MVHPSTIPQLLLPFLLFITHIDLLYFSCILFLYILYLYVRCNILLFYSVYRHDQYHLMCSITYDNFNIFLYQLEHLKYKKFMSFHSLISKLNNDTM